MLSPVRPADLKKSLSYVLSYNLSNMPTVTQFGPLMTMDFMGNAHKLIGKKGNPTALQSLYYPALPADSKFTAGELRCGEHTDYGTITFLFQDDVGGLDFKSPGLGYIPATPLPGTVLVNIGSLLQRWTSESLIATEHRVLILEEEIRRRIARQSVAFFATTNADDDYVVNGLDNSEKYKPIKTIDYLNYRFESAYTNYKVLIERTNLR